MSRSQFSARLPAWRAFPCSSLYYGGNANTAEKITSLFLREKTKKKTWWLRDETTYVACSNTEKNLFKGKRCEGRTGAREKMHIISF